ncbi:MAG: bacillithiol biosynthesis protein BshC, partial [Acidobacteriota bacterium]
GGSMPVFDAANPSDKPALVPLACRLVRERTDVKKLLAERGAALEAAGHPLQVTSDPAALPLFARVGRDRLLLLETGSRLSLKGLDGTFEAEEVVDRFVSGAWLPSFSALTRPLTASVLFPVSATILGPAEIAYWAQGWPLFSWAGIVPPVIVPRPLVALVPAATARVLSKLGLSVEDVLGGEEAMLRKKGAGSAQALLERLAAIREGTIRALEAEEPALLAVDSALRKAVDTTREKTSFAFEKLVEKTAAAAGRSDERTAAQVRRLAEEILPSGVLAERAYSALPYVLRFGRGAVVGALRRDLVWNEPGLQVISL